MNKEKFNNVEIPMEKLIEREKTAIFQAKKKQKTRRTTNRSILVACGLCVTLLGSGFVSTGMAEALSNIPLIGPIYKEFKDIASDKIEQEQLSTIIEKKDSRNGLTMNVKEAVYDGGRLIVTVEYTGEKGVSLEEETVGYNYVTINGKLFKAAIGGAGQEVISTNTIIEHNQFTLANYDEYGDNIKVGIHGEDLFGYKGEWNVEFPIEKIEGNILEFNPEVKAESSDKIYTLTTKKVTFSPLSTRIDLTIDYPVEMDENDTWKWFEFSVVDDKGIIYDGLKLQHGMAGNFGHHMVIALPPMDTIPKSLTLKPSDINNEGYREEIKELGLVIPLDNME